MPLRDPDPTLHNIYPKAPDPTFFSWRDVADAAFATENVIYGTYLHLNAPRFTPDPNFDIFAQVSQDYKNEAPPFSQFLGVRSLPEYQHRRAEIEQRNRKRQVLSQSSLGANLLWTGAAGLLDPTSLIPFSWGLKGISYVGKAATLGGLAVGLQEVELARQQPERTAEEMFKGTVMGAALAGLLGGAGVALSPKRFGRLQASMYPLPSNVTISPVVRDRIETQLLAAKVAAPEARANATLFSLAMENIARRAGTTGERLLQDYELSIGRKISLSEIGDAVTLQQAAWHGSGAVFDRFDLTYNKTGEGANSYGWGHYFSQIKQIAEDYRKADAARKGLPDGNRVFYKGTLVEKFFPMAFKASPEERAIGSVATQMLYGDDFLRAQRNLITDTEATLKMIKEEIAKHEEAIAAEKAFSVPQQHLLNIRKSHLEKARASLVYTEDELSALRELKAEDFSTETVRAGRTYKVELPEHDQLLDWDEPLGQSPLGVREKLSAAVEKGKKSAAREIARTTEPYLLKDLQRLNRGMNVLLDYLNPVHQAQYEILGVHFYKQLKQIFGSDRAASEWLNAAGIPGHRFRTGSTRGRADRAPKYNFVIYGDEHVSITAYEQANRGQIAIFPSGKALIELTASADRSTFLHESAHYFLHVMQQLETKGDVFDDDLKLLRRWLGEDLASREAQEKFARGFEQYLREGRAPRSGLEALFATFRDWLVNIYRSAADLNVELSPEIRGFFDELVGGPEVTGPELMLSVTPSTVGAASVRPEDAGPLKGALGAERLVGWMNGVVYNIQQKASPAARQATQWLGDEGLLMAGNQAVRDEAGSLVSGRVTAPGGTVEALSHRWYAHLGRALQRKDDLYVEYFTGKPASLASRLATDFGNIVQFVQRQAGGTPRKLSAKEFNERIGLAMNKLDKDFEGIPQIEEAARYAREELTNKLYEEAVNVGIFTGSEKLKGDLSHLFRIYVPEIVSGYRNQFEDILAKHFAEKANVEFTEQYARLKVREAQLGEREATLKLSDAEAAARRASLEAETKALYDADAAAPESMAELNKRLRDLRRIARGTPDDWRQAGFADQAAVLAEREAVRKRGGKGLEEFRRQNAELRRQFRDLDKRKKGQQAFVELEQMRGRGRERLNERARAKGATMVDLENGTFDFTEVSRDLAQQFTDVVQGSYLRTPFFDSIGLRGTELGRFLDIPVDKLVTDDGKSFVNLDAEQVFHAYTRTLAPDIELYRKFGSVNPLAKDGDLLARIKEDFAARRDEARGSPKEEKLLRNLAKVEAEVLKNLETQIERIRHTRGIPSDPSSIPYRLGKSAKHINNARLMGSVMISSIPDIARLIMKFKLRRVFNDLLWPVITNWKGIVASAAEARNAGEAWDAILYTRAKSFAEILDDYGRQSKLERGIEYLSNRIGVVAMFAHWTAAMKQASAVLANAHALEALEVLARGDTAHPKWAGFHEWSNQMGIGPYAKQLWEELERTSTQVGSIRLPNTEDMVGEVVMPNGQIMKLKHLYQGMMNRTLQDTIVTPGIGRPRWMDENVGLSMIAQFRSFAFASTTKTLLAGLQKRDADVAVGAMISLAFGALSYYLWATAVGGDRYKEMLKASPEKWLDEAIDRSGLLAVISEVQRIGETIPGVAPYVRLSQQATTQREGVTLMEALAGPSYGLLKAGTSFLVGVDDPTRQTLHQLRLLLPYQNLFYFRQVLDKLEAASGLPESRR